MTFPVFFTKAMAFLLSIFMTAIPYAGFGTLGLQTKEDDCLLNVEMVSDVHIEEKELFRQAFMKILFSKVNNSKTKVDGILVAGDLTNYADEASLARYYELTTQSKVPVISVSGNHDIGHVGDRGVTDITKYEAKENLIRYHNQYMNDDVDTNYFSYELNGYKFIAIGDEVDGFTTDENGNRVPYTGGHWDDITFTEAQLEFLDRELAEGTAEGKPCFVISHWAIDGINGEDIIWDGSGIDLKEYDICSILEKYDNVFFISGHMHGGVRCTAVGEAYNMPMAEEVNGVVYMSLPTYAILNQYGIPWSGTGAQLEVYGGKVIFRPINYLTGKWYENSSYSFNLK